MTIRDCCYTCRKRAAPVLNREDLLPFVMMILTLPFKYFRILADFRQKKSILNK